MASQAPGGDEDAVEPRANQALDEPSPLSATDIPHHRSRTLIAAATVVAVALIAIERHNGPDMAKPGLPATPTAWVEQWTAPTLESPARVCDHLFAPALAAAFKTEAGHMCVSQYSSSSGTSFRVRHVLEDGGTASVEAQQVRGARKLGYLTIVLTYIRGGWQAVDVVPGRSRRPR